MGVKCGLCGTGEIHMGSLSREKGGSGVERPHRERWTSTKTGETDAGQEDRVTENQLRNRLKSESSKGEHRAAPEVLAHHYYRMTP